MIFRTIKDLCGTKLLVLFFLSVPIGVAVGLAEILFGYALQNFLAAYQLLPLAETPLRFLPIIFHPIVLILIVAIVQAVLIFMNSMIPNIAFEGFQKRVRTLMTVNSFGGYDSERTLSVGDASHILSNLTPKAAGFLSHLSQLISALIVFVTMVVGMIFISFDLTYITAGLLLVAGAPMFFLRNAFKKSSENIQTYSAQFIKTVIRNIKNLYFLRMMGTQRREMESALRLNEQLFKNYMRYFFGVTVNAVLPLFVAVIMVVSIVMANSTHRWVTPALLVTFVYLLTRLAQSVGRIATGFGYVQLNIPFMREVIERREYFEKHYPIDEAVLRRGSQETPGSLVVSDLSVGRGKPYLDPITFSLNRGDFLLISGPSGRGKTTLLMTLIGIVPRLKGKILWNGVPLEKLDLIFLKKHVGYSGADPFLFDGTIEENLLYAVPDKDHARKNIKKALDTAQCSFVYELHGGLLHVLREGGEGVSAGQKQRISLARALLREPSLLLLDEATANLDEMTEASILENIRMRHQHITIIAVSHRISLTSYATQAIAL